MKKPQNISQNRSQDRAKPRISQEEWELKVAARFPEIEKLLQTEDFTSINQHFTAAYDVLEKENTGRSGFGKSQDARKAMKAIEKSMDLLRELLRAKYRLADNPSAPPGEVLSPQKKK